MLVPDHRHRHSCPHPERLLDDATLYFWLRCGSGSVPYNTLRSLLSTSLESVGGALRVQIVVGMAKSEKCEQEQGFGSNSLGIASRFVPLHVGLFVEYWCFARLPLWVSTGRLEPHGP